MVNGNKHTNPNLKPKLNPILILIPISIQIQITITIASVILILILVKNQVR